MKLYVGNLSFKMTLEDLKNEFSKYGAVEDAVIITDKFSGRSKGFGFITPEQGQGDKDLFVHVNNIQGTSLEEGQEVEYVKGEGRKGPEATEVVAVH